MYGICKVISIRNGDIIKQIQKIVIGGKDSSKEIKNLSIQEVGNMLAAVFYSYNTFCIERRPIRIRGSDKEQISKYIISVTNNATSETKLLKTKNKEDKIADNEIRIEVTDEKGKQSPVLVDFNDSLYLPLHSISTIFAFPTEPTAGIKFIDKVFFGANVPLTNDNSICLGKLIKSIPTNINVNINVDDLTQHAFVTGVTGSGKTTTIKYLLEQLISRKNPIPFLVLEPAKDEYKLLELGVESHYYNLGGANNGLKINPLFFPEGIHIQTHIDHIKSIFIAAFPMYGPMPYILETAIYNVYRNKGWDLITGKTYRKQDKYPTLEDLLYEIDLATESVGYSSDLQSDIKGALKVRIQSLITGAKGNVLNCTHEESVEKLLNRPTIISLESIGDPQEKVFLMGLLLTSIYEYYISKKKYNKNLVHLLVFEEAHRLLENVQSNNNPEIADMKGKALETFNNILSEIRAYGQGILIADQIPSKLSPDVIKNTNLKIIHRLLAKDDRELVGNSIGLNDEQIKHLIHLKTGKECTEAVTFYSNLDDPVKLRVSAIKKHYDLSTDNAHIHTDNLYDTYSLVDNPFFISECCKWLRTCLLLNIYTDEYSCGIKKISSDFGCIEISEFNQREIFNKSANIVINEIKLLDKIEISYISRLNLLDKIFEQQYPALQSAVNKLLQADSLVPEAEIFELFYPTIHYKEKFLTKTDLIHYGELNLSTEQIIAISDCKNTFSLNLLNNDKYNEKISDCIVFNVFKSFPQIIDKYFGIVDMTVKGIYSKEQYDNTGEANSNLNLILDELYNNQKLLKNFYKQGIELISKIANTMEQAQTKKRNNNFKYLPSLSLLLVN